jgi:hypothetical protein
LSSTVLAKDVLLRVSQQLLDAPDAARQFRRWSEQELLGWLNEGQRVIAKFLPASCSRLDALKLAAGTRQSLDSIAAADMKPADGSDALAVKGKQLLDVVRNMGADGLTPGRAIRVVQRDALDAIDPLWHTRTDSAISEYLYDPRNPKVFWVYPGVTGAMWAEVSYLANPAEIPYEVGSMRMDGASTVLLSIDDQYVDDLENYMLARAHLKESEVASNAQLASSYVNIFVSSINAQAKAMTGTNPNLKFLPFAPEAPGAAS